MPRKRTAFNAEDRLLDLRVLPGLEPMILLRIMPTYLLLVFEMMIFRNSIQSGTEFFLVNDTNPI